MTKRILRVVAVLALATGLLGAFGPAEAQDQIVRVDGLVQWIGGLRMVVQTDTGPSVGVDLASVPQSDYAGLVVRQRVAVIGTVSPENRDIVGTSVVRAERSR